MKKHVILFSISLLIVSALMLVASVFGLIMDAGATEACPPGYWFKDEEAPWEYTARPGYIIYQVCIKAGTSCFIYQFDQTDGCYIVTGLGTGHVTVTGGGAGKDCQAISHVAFYKMTVTTTPTWTATSTFTPTNTNTPTSTATHTSTMTPTNTVTPTGTISPSLTPTITITPTWTTTPGTVTATTTSTPITPLPPRTPWKTPHKDTELPKTGFFEDSMLLLAGAVACIGIIAIARVARKRN